MCKNNIFILACVSKLFYIFLKLVANNIKLICEMTINADKL